MGDTDKKQDLYEKKSFRISRVENQWTNLNYIGRRRRFAPAGTDFLRGYEGRGGERLYGEGEMGLYMGLLKPERVDQGWGPGMVLVFKGLEWKGKRQAIT